jgi:dinuclear metal center YbgI/SA1388 family protein
MRLSRNKEMIERQKLVSFLDELLQLSLVKSDCSNNGLQVEGNCEVRKVVFGVDASVQLFMAAADLDADFIFVHHGISWGDSLKRLTGLNAGRVRALFQNDISLYGAHLPLDMHPQVGHNALIAEALGIKEKQPFFAYAGVEIGFYGDLPEPLTPSELATLVGEKLETEPSLWPLGPERVRRVGIVSGGGGDAIDECAGLGIDCLITGEALHQQYHSALESGLNVIVGGHYRTEVPGVRRVMEEVQAAFEVKCTFVDLPTGL